VDRSEEHQFHAQRQRQRFRVSTITARRGAAPSADETAFSMAFDMDTPFRVYGSFQDHGSYRGVVDISKGRDNLQPIAWEARQAASTASTRSIPGIRTSCTPAS
jgi:hypothetical protein